MTQERYPGELIGQYPHESITWVYERIVEAQGPEPASLREAACDAVRAAQTGTWTPTATDRAVAWTVIQGLQWTEERPWGPSFSATKQLFDEALAADLSEPMARLLTEAAKWEPKLSAFGSWGESLAAIVLDDLDY